LIACEGLAFDCGPTGKYVAPGATPLGPSTWIIPRDRIPAADNSVASIHCYHMREHLFGDDAVAFLREVERVLIPERGVFNFSVRYFSSLLQAQRTPDGRQLARLLRPHR
jgi:hypothetical protein